MSVCDFDFIVSVLTRSYWLFVMGLVLTGVHIGIRSLDPGLLVPFIVYMLIELLRALCVAVAYGILCPMFILLFVRWKGVFLLTAAIVCGVGAFLAYVYEVGKGRLSINMATGVAVLTTLLVMVYTAIFSKLAVAIRSRQLNQRFRHLACGLPLVLLGLGSLAWAQEIKGLGSGVNILHLIATLDVVTIALCTIVLKRRFGRLIPRSLIENPASE